jgi:hypothetical protein
MSVLKQLRLAAALIAPLLLPSAGQAGVMTGRELLGICEPSRADPVYRLKISECTGYIIGVSDTFDCINKTLSFNWDDAQFTDQRRLVATVVDWFHLHPHVLHYQASGLVASALATHYPCPGSVAAK